MDKFGKIFVGMDFSPGADEALRQAHDLAAAQAKLAVCHVVPNEIRCNVLFPHMTRIDALKVPLELERVSETVSARVTEVTGRAPGEFDVIVDDGIPYAAILTNAEEWAADLIVVGSHGTTSAADMLLGSVTNRIIRYAHCPVLITRAGNRTGGIVAGTDFSDPALPALRAAANEARRMGVELTLVHSIDVGLSTAAYAATAFDVGPIDFSGDQMEELESVTKEKLAHAVGQLDVKAQTLVMQGAAGPALIEIAAQLKASLIVVGTTGRTGLRRVLLGSVAETVAMRSPCSVLIVRLHST